MTAITIYDPKQLAEQISNQQLTISVLTWGNSEITPVMRDTVHFGIIPGTDKPTLLKPGAELLCRTFGLYADYEPMTQIEDFGGEGKEPLFYYRYKCVLHRIEDGAIVATGIGSCNSRESKYGYRWLPEHEIPAHLDKSKLQRRVDSIDEFDFAVTKAETTGKYGKPAEYWQEFQDAIADRTAQEIQKQTKKGMSKAWRITTITFQVPNPEIASQVNTIDKMAQKRSLIAATLNGTAASEFFTQDVEDLPEFAPRKASTPSEIIEGQFEEVTETEKPKSKRDLVWDIIKHNDYFPNVTAFYQYMTAQIKAGAISTDDSLTDMVTYITKDKNPAPEMPIEEPVQVEKSNLEKAYDLMTADFDSFEVFKDWMMLQDLKFGRLSTVDTIVQVVNDKLEMVRQSIA
jgi:hypothetical protein